jgi:hypothetical protein
MALQPADFRTHCGFRRRAARVWSLECATTIADLQNPPQVPAVHSLHLPTALEADRFGSALPRAVPRGFTDFDGIRSGRFRARRSIAQVRCVYQFRHRGVGAKSTVPEQLERSPCGTCTYLLL